MSLLRRMFTCAFIGALLLSCSGPTNDPPMPFEATATQDQTSIEPTDPAPVATATSPTTVTATEQASQESTTIPPAPTTTDTPAATPEPSPSPTTATPPPAPPQTSVFDPAAVSLDVELAGSGFVEPTFVTHAGDGSGQLYVTEKSGVIRFLSGKVFLDLTDRVISTGLEGNQREQGLLGLAFHPDFETNGEFFVHYNDENGDTIVSRFQAGSDGLGDPASEQVLLTLDQPEDHFNGGMIAFGPDGYFYIALGTGGGRPEDFAHAQDLGSLFGKLLRIDVDSGDPYAIPPDNPFVGVEGARPEVWAIGLRNPWRFAFDRETNELYIADAGQFNWEEVNYQPAGSSGGENYGWPVFEGRHCFEADTCEPPPNYRGPIIEYPRGELGCVIIGGYVYRGSQSPDLRGAYLYSDFCTARVWAGWRDASGAWQTAELLQLSTLISSFGEDEAGELYLVSIADGQIYRLIDAS